MTLGSLFDGSGGFPLGGMFVGIETKWASEVEPFPIKVTTTRFPDVKHYGDVSKMNGAEIEPVDIITFGSPCQDMSIAGNREGLGGSRSGLFHEAIRIIKEMREATDGRYPKYAVWENVKGCLSSNNGEDFRSVLNEFCKIKDKTVFIPKPENGKWSNAGCIMADDYSVAWRLFDAEYWGIPQRRERIYLVADFMRRGADKILFESEGLSGYSDQSFKTWKKTSFPDGKRFKSAAQRERERVIYSQKRYDQYDEDDKSTTLCAHGGNYGGGTQTLLVERDGIGINGDIASTLDAHYYRGTGSRGGVEREVICQKIGNDDVLHE